MDMRVKMMVALKFLIWDIQPKIIHKWSKNHIRHIIYIITYKIRPFCPSRYPLGTLFSRQHAQHTDIIHTMHTMHKGGIKSSGLEYAIKLDG